MAIAPAELWPEVQLGTANLTLVTSPSGGNGLVVKRAVFTNTNTSPTTVTVYKVPASGTAGTANLVIDGYSLAIGEAWVPPSLINMVLPPGATLVAKASIAAVVNTTGSGFTF